MSRTNAEHHRQIEETISLSMGEPINTQKPFISWDGEGITPAKTGELEPPQDYVLFGASTGDMVKAPSLSTMQCLDLLLSVERSYPDSIHVGFSLRYDVNMILKDLPQRKLLQIFKCGRCHWKGYYLEYRPGKWLTVNRRAKNGKQSPTVKLFDVFGFFQCSFVKACEDFLGANDPELVAIREGKAARQSFSYEQLDSLIVPYMASELRMMVRLMDALRGSMISAGLPLKSWHGAGAVAALIMQQYKVKLAMAETPPEVRETARYAYAGGRFELFQCGMIKERVYEYDIRSAYPAAMQKLPNLSRGKWCKTSEFTPGSFGVWKVDYSSREQWLPLPLFRRHKEGMVSFPHSVQGWYWTPEVELIPVECVKYGYVFVEDDINDKPFSFVGPMYETRRKWKEEGNSAQMAYKLGLNSLYGKTAQRVGGVNEKPPIYHQLEWAGYVTSATRAKIYRAVQLAPASIIAIETDAVFSTEALPLDIGTGLGQWECTEFDSICYVQSGFYFARKGEVEIEKYRGFDKGSVKLQDVSHAFALMHYANRCNSSFLPTTLGGTTTRFIGFGIALHTKAVWRSWETNKYRGVKIGGDSKRKHIINECPQCSEMKPLLGHLHRLAVNLPGGPSFPHSLPWIDGIEREPNDWEENEELVRF